MPQSGGFQRECDCYDCRERRRLQLQQLIASKLKEYKEENSSNIEEFDKLLIFIESVKKIQTQPEVEKKYTATWGYKPNYFIDPKEFSEYSIPELKDDNTGKDNTMTGYEYVQTHNLHRANYSHMRAMLQHAWKNTGQRVPFDIDTRFQRDNHKIAEYLRETFSDSQLDQAHYDARATYSRGRPKGARNIDKIKSFNELDTVFKDESSQFNQDNAKALEENKNQDTSDFVLMSWLKQQGYVNATDLGRVASNVGLALKTYVEEEIAKIKLNVPTTIEIKRTNLPTLDMGVQHRCFPSLLKICNASLRGGSHLNVWVYGPAGTGKSTAAELVAKALELEFYTLGKQSTEYGILGFINVSGYQTTEFRRAYENGGIFCGDEIDGWMPDALIALNMALANGHCAFPDKMVKRHPNFIFIACANTVGTGATMDYVGRMKQDAAFLDRFVSLYWPLDEALEDSLVANKQWLGRVRYVRNKIQQVGIKGHLITPRAAIFGEALLAAGLSIKEVEQSTLQKGLSDTQWSQVKPPTSWIDDVAPIFEQEQDYAA